MLPTISHIGKTTTQSATAYTQPETAVISTEKASHHETNIKGNDFVVALSVTVAKSAIIILAVVFTKLRINYGKLGLLYSKPRRMHNNVT